MTDPFDEPDPGLNEAIWRVADVPEMKCRKEVVNGIVICGRHGTVAYNPGWPCPVAEAVTLAARADVPDVLSLATTPSHAMVGILLWNVRERLKKMASEDWRGPEPSHISEAQALVDMINTVIPSVPNRRRGGR